MNLGTIDKESTLKTEHSFCLSEEAWHTLYLQQGGPPFIFQRDLTWIVERTPLRLTIKRIRYSGTKTPVVMEKDMDLDGKGNIIQPSRETIYQIDPTQAQQEFDQSYLFDRVMTKFRAESRVGYLTLCFDHLVSVGYFLKIELDHGGDFDCLLDFEESVGLAGKEQAKPYGLYLDSPSFCPVTVL